MTFSVAPTATGLSPTHRLEVNLSSTVASLIVDNTTARPDIESYVSKLHHWQSMSAST